MTRLVVAAEAETDTTAIISYLERNAGALVAAEYGMRFIHAIDRIVEMPSSGALRPSLGERVRIGIVSPYIVIYEYDRLRDEVTLLRILHGRRNISRIMQPD
jgi:toxin ParE1/3/4